jgi:transcriptional regulator with GAF, ATPase, and Fis domain
MPLLRFIAAHDPAAATCAQLTQRWESRQGSRATSPETAAHCVLVIAHPDAQSVARIAEFFAAHPQIKPDRTVAVCLDHGREALQQVLALGFGDVLEYSDEVLAAIDARIERWRCIDAAISRPAVAAHLVGGSGAWRAVLRSVAECAMFSSAPVLLTGPTGTGKELLARLLHTLDGRPDKQELVIVDCTTLAPDLGGSELFGHERGAFTGAVTERDGAVMLADGGTLFLDEVGELSLDHQARLLRVLQERVFRRIGGTAWRRSEFRLVCATNRELRAEVAAGRFRSDLFHRIAAITVRTPALGERRTDIPALVRHVIDQQSGKGGKPAVAPALLEYFAERRFDGNVRELAQLVQACLRRYAGVGMLSLGTLPEDELRRSGDPPGDAGDWCESRVTDFVRRALRARVGLKELARLVESTAVRLAIEESESLTAAAQRLGVTPRALHLRRAAERDSPQH